MLQAPRPLTGLHLSIFNGRVVVREEVKFFRNIS